MYSLFHVIYMRQYIINIWTKLSLDFSRRAMPNLSSYFIFKNMVLSTDDKVRMTQSMSYEDHVYELWSVLTNHLHVKRVNIANRCIFICTLLGLRFDSILQWFFFINTYKRIKPNNIHLRELMLNFMKCWLFKQLQTLITSLKIILKHCLIL